MVLAVQLRLNSITRIQRPLRVRKRREIEPKMSVLTLDEATTGLSISAAVFRRDVKPISANGASQSAATPPSR